MKLNQQKGISAKLIIFGIFIIFVLSVINSGFFIVEETEQYIVTRFGKPIRDPITHAGVYFKIPWFDKSIKIEKRVLEWDGYPSQKNTKGKKYIIVDITARWRIVDALKFLQTVRTEGNAQSRLDDILDSATSEVISNHELDEAVRSSNIILDDERFESSKTQLDIETDENRIVLKPIKVGRQKIQELIKENAAPTIRKYGIELVDVRIKRLNYEKSVQTKVFDRMISERRRIADKLRSQGRGKKAEIEGKMMEELNKIESEAYKTAEKIKGEADAKAASIYANAYNQNKEFYDFYKSLETYKTTLNSKHTLFMSADGEFYKLLNN